MGVGMIAVVRPGDAEDVTSAVRAQGVEVWRIGTVEAGAGVRYLT